ncbi:class I SAM-dependent methyltransferase [Paenibacillus guangzhouensis]|uniref:class I SAM-dependent methyltransferase n=1 Tax=Paenibacillus guangzhouensis TaxID=1473112 RepID=UPI001D0F6420|nr:class I SAM-dependent methyltransferase [Paenibacillus guangzhouensis]
MDKHYYGDLCALYYDIDKPTAPPDELALLLSFASPGMRILEPMCGSGRFIVPFAERGYSIDGFDLSEAMIARCREKLIPLHAASRIDLCDFAGFDRHREPYDLIFIAAGSFSLLTDQSMIKEALQVMKQCLKPDGRIVLSVLTDRAYRSAPITKSHSESASEQEGRSVQQGSIEVVLKGSNSVYEPENRVQSSLLTYELYVEGQYVRSESEDFHLKLYGPNDFDVTVDQCGLTIDRKYTDLGKSNTDYQHGDAIWYELSK